MVNNLAVYLAVDAWSEFNGSTIPADCWQQYPRLITRGVTQATYILWPDNPVQDRDLERLHNDVGFDILVLRLGTPKGTHPGAPADFIAKHKPKIMHAKAQGYRRIYLLRFSEPNAELVIENADGTFTLVMTPAEYDVWDTEVVRLLDDDPDLADIPLIGPPIGGYNDIPNHPGSSWVWWDQAIRAANIRSDLGGVNLYPATLAEIGVGLKPTDPNVPGYSLPWWQGQMPGKPLYVCEMGCRTGTPPVTRDTLLPILFRQIKNCADVVGSAWFVQWTAGQEHMQHWWTDEQIGDFLAVIAEPMGTEQPAPQPIPLPVPPPTIAGDYKFTLTMPDGTQQVYGLKVEKAS